jgi:hypothetical protein
MQDPLARISGSNITSIGDSAFFAAFANYTANELRIGSKIKTIGP